MALPLDLLLSIVDLRGGAGVYCRLVADALHQSFAGEVAVSLLTWTAAGQLPEDRERFRAIHCLNRPVHPDWRRVYEPVAQARSLRQMLRRIDPEVILTVGTYAN